MKRVYFMRLLVYMSIYKIVVISIVCSTTFEKTIFWILAAKFFWGLISGPVEPPQSWFWAISGNSNFRRQGVWNFGKTPKSWPTGGTNCPTPNSKSKFPKNIGWAKSISLTEILTIMFNFGGILATESTFEQLLSCPSLIVCNLGLPFI